MNERKYKIKDNQIVKRDGETPIPEGEPPIYFQGKRQKGITSFTCIPYGM